VHNALSPPLTTDATPINLSKPEKESWVGLRVAMIAVTDVPLRMCGMSDMAMGSVNSMLFPFVIVVMIVVVMELNRLTGIPY